jgi:hypothetical protein
MVGRDMLCGDLDRRAIGVWNLAGGLERGRE